MAQSASGKEGRGGDRRAPSSRSPAHAYDLGSGRRSPFFRVICADVPGFGRSYIPPDADDSRHSSKRENAAALVELRRQLGHQTFHAVGHDRGTYTAFRMAMNHPDIVRKLVVVDCLPILEHLERADWKFAPGLVPLVLLRAAGKGGARDLGRPAGRVTISSRRECPLMEPFELAGDFSKRHSELAEYMPATSVIKRSSRSRGADFFSRPGSARC